MGAYSSFPMLALTHHVIVQLAAKRVGFTEWFSNYALLGDDIVIADPKVGTAYLLIMRDYLGVEINLSKSLESNLKVCEFAKRLFKGTEDLTPVSPKVLLLAYRNIMFLPDLVRDLVSKQMDFDASSLLTLMRSPQVFKNTRGYNVFKAVWMCSFPFGPVQQSLLPFLESKSVEVFYTIRDFIREYNSKMNRAANKLIRQALAS